MEDKNKILPRINDCGPYFLRGGGNIYDTTIFKQFFESDDSRVLGWAENVYDKLENANILPAFIRKKDNEDFRSLWFTVAKMFAFVTIYARQFNEIDTNKILFEAFINNKGLVTSLVDSQEQMEYLFNNYLTEFAKRGRLDIVSMSGDILGEFLRLIRYSSQDEFIFALLQPQNTGWCLGWSSPTWEKTQLVTNVTKDYEFTQSIMDISKYPLLSSDFIYPVQDRDGADDIIEGITFTGQQPVGIDGTQDLSKLIVVDPNLSYEISFFLKKASDNPSLVRFGVVGYDETKTKTYEMQVMENGGWATTGSNYFHTSPTLDLPNDGIYYYIRGILFSSNERYYNAPALSFPSGRALSIPADVRYIALQIIQDRSSVDDTYVYLYDIKVKPLYLPFSQGYFGEKNIVATYFKNNSYQSKDSLDEYTKNFLLSYKNVLGSEIIPFYEGEKVYNICFKVFSTKYIYLQDATISIFGQTFKTDVNGECVVPLPKGEFVYTVTAKEEQFQPYNSVLAVTGDAVQYVQVLGDDFQWTVTFQVTGTGGLPLQGAVITMNNQVQTTSARGIAFFNVFKGEYSYKISAEGYYDTEKNITVTTDTVENVEMEEVPYKNVSFRVRDGVEPVSGATIVVNVEGTDQTGTTNATGVATGFVMKPGTYTYLISKSGYITQKEEFTIVDNAVIDINMQKVPKYNVVFNVTYNDLPLENTFVTFNSVTLATNKQGQVTFQEINGTYNYTVSKDDFIDQTGSITVKDADVTKSIAILPKTYTLSFHVVNGIDPVQNATIVVGTETKTTDADGNASFIRPSATYNWTITAPGMYKKQGFTTVNKKDTAETVDMMYVTYDVTFVVRASGQPLRGASVILDSQELVTNTNGQVIFNKRAGTYPYSVSAEGYDGETGDITITNANVQQNVELTMITGALTVKVTDENGVAIPSASVTVNNETKSTNVEGVAGTWNLPPKQYNYVVTAANYDDRSGVVSVSKDGTDITVQMKLSVAPTYDLTFNVYSSGASIANAQIYIGTELVAITNSSGQATVKREAGQYGYRVVADYFEEYSGTVSVATSQQINVSLVRLTSEVTFMVKDIDTSEAIASAVVLFNNEVQNTDSSGSATFMNVVQGQSLSYVITKLPPYKNAQGTILVNASVMTKEVYMGEVTYSVFFSIKDPSGVAMKNVTCQIGSFSAVTAEDGTAVIEGIKNGSYDYKCFTNGYESLSGQVVVYNGNAYLNLVMYRLKANILVTVNDIRNQPVSGVNVISGDIHGVTDSTGRTTLTVDEGTYTFTVTQDSFLDESFSITVVAGDAVEKVITFQDCCSVDIQLIETGRVTLPIRDNFSGTQGALRVKWGDGTTTSGISYHDYAESGVYRVVFNYNNSDNVLYWSCDFYANALFKSSLLRVVSWFLTKSTVMEKGGFKNCTQLISLQTWNTDNFRGTGEEMYMGCTSLTTYPANNLGFVTTCKRMFRESGMASTVNLSDIFQNVTASDFTETFYGCNFIGLTGSLPVNASLCISIFESCLSLVNVGLDVFKGSTPSIVTRAFALSRVETTVAMNLAPASDASYCYYGCSSLSRLVTGTVTSTGNVNLAHICDSCPSLLATLNEGVFNCATTNFSYAFFGCTKLDSVENLLPLNGVTGDASYCFSLTGMTSIPFNAFSGLLGREGVPVSFAHGFESCNLLGYIGANEMDNMDWTRSPFYGTNISDMSYCFRNCGILKQSPEMFSASDDVMGHTYEGTPIWTCSNWDYTFENCTTFGANVNTAPSLTIEGATYKIWNVHNIPGSVAPEQAVGCFRNCASLTDFSTIPSTWK